MAVSVIKNDEYRLNKLEEELTISSNNLLLNESIEVSGTTSWQRGSWDVDVSEYKQIMIRVGSHGATMNSAIVDVDVLRLMHATYPYSLFSYWESGNLVVLNTYMKSGMMHISVSAKTYSLAADVQVIGYK